MNQAMQHKGKKLFRGSNVGVFAGTDGYYVAAMCPDGVSHYASFAGGISWEDDWLDHCNAIAERMDKIDNERI